MKIIIKNNEKTKLIEKSKFIGMVFKVFNEDEIEKILTSLQDKYSDATHICYAYILPNKVKYTDDKEPTGTAGRPICEVLQKNDLCYTLAVVIRYFGGIKLGTGGLVRAYTKTILETLINNVKEKEDGYLITICENYNKQKELDYLLKNSQIIHQEFLNKIRIEAIVSKKTLDSLSSIHYSITKEVIY